MRIFTEGTQDQYFYAQPAPADPPVGTRISVPDQIDSVQLSLAAGIVFRFK